jgi:hypothetical protein
VLKKNLPQTLSWAAQIVTSEATREGKRGGTFQLVAKVHEAGEGDSEGNGEASQVSSKLKQDAKPASSKSVSFLAAKGKLERNPQEEVTREERTDRSSSKTKTIYKPKKRKAKDSESDDDDVSVNLIDSENDDSHLDPLVVGMLKGLQKQINKLSNSAPTHSWQQRNQQQQQDVFQRHQRSPAGSWIQNDHYFPHQRGICYRFQNMGVCDIDRCKFSHIDEGNTAARPRHQDPGVPQSHAQKQPHLQQQQQVHDNLMPCFDFQRGHCSRNMCRFSHNQQNQQQHQQQRQIQRAANMPPETACRSMWARSTCDNYRCVFDHGSFDSRADVCKSFLMQTHCPFLFSNKGCNFSHLVQEQDANQMPLGGARSQRQLLSKADPEQEDN